MKADRLNIGAMQTSQQLVTASGLLANGAVALANGTFVLFAIPLRKLVFIA